MTVAHSVSLDTLGPIGITLLSRGLDQRGSGRTSQATGHFLVTSQRTGGNGVSAGRPFYICQLRQ